MNKQTKLFFFIFLYTVLSGAIRKWFIDLGVVNNFVFGIQLLSPFLFIIFDWQGVKKIFDQNSLFSLFVFYCIIIAFHPFILTPEVGMLGFIFHINFWLLGFYYLANRDILDLKKIVGPIIITCAAIIVLAFIQYSLPQGNILNKYVDDKNVGGIIAEVGTSVRVTSTFSYISGFSAFLLFLILFVWALIKMEYTPIISVGLLFFGLICCLMNGSRGSTYTFILIAAFFLVFEARNANIKHLLSRLFFPLLIVILIFQSGSINSIADKVNFAFANFETRRTGLTETGEEKSRFLQDFNALSDFKFKYPIFGVGLGSTYQGSSILFGTSEYVLEYGLPESENIRMMLEGGFILIIFRLLLIVSFCKQLSVSLLSKLLFGGFFFITPTVYNIYITIFFFMGIAFVDKAYFLSTKVN